MPGHEPVAAEQCPLDILSVSWLPDCSPTSNILDSFQVGFGIWRLLYSTLLFVPSLSRVGYAAKRLPELNISPGG